jgi:hypothetical protein
MCVHVRACLSGQHCTDCKAHTTRKADRRSLFLHLKVLPTGALHTGVSHTGVSHRCFTSRRFTQELHTGVSHTGVHTHRCSHTQVFTHPGVHTYRCSHTGVHTHRCFTHKGGSHTGISHTGVSHTGASHKCMLLTSQMHTQIAPNLVFAGWKRGASMTLATDRNAHP